MPWLFLLASIWGAGFTYNAHRPFYRPQRLAALSFFAAWPTGELALHHIAWQLAATLAFAWAGALAAWPGQLGLAISIASWVGLFFCYRRQAEAAAAIESALRQGLGGDYREEIRPELQARFSDESNWRRILLPFPTLGPEVERIRDIPYTRAAGLTLKLDVYRQLSRPANCPTLLQIHGGAWVIGSKNEQSLPLMIYLAARGWVCVSANYRLSPHATFPEHVIDLKRAIQWIRDHGPEFGADPDFLVVTGGSAGGHLAALVGLTGDDPEYQPGFEEVDTSVQACVPFYGIYDFRNRFGHWHHDGLAELLEKRVMKASPEEAPEAYEKASPISRISAAAPPFLVVHGDRDTLAPVAEARRFCEAFRRRARSPLVYAEIPGAQHAFEIFYSRRSLEVISGVERFLAYVYSQYLNAQETGTAAAGLAATGIGSRQVRGGTAAEKARARVSRRA